MTDRLVLRERGLFQRYVDRLSVGVRDELLRVAVGQWVDIELYLDHSRAIDSLGGDEQSAFEFGIDVADLIHGKLLKTMMTLAGQVGVTPWAALSQAQKLWARSYRGGAVRIERYRANLARLEVLRTPVVPLMHSRHRFRGTLHRGIEPLCDEPQVQELAGLRTDDSCVFELRWR